MKPEPNHEWDTVKLRLCWLVQMLLALALAIGSAWLGAWLAEVLL